MYGHGQLERKVLTGVAKKYFLRSKACFAIASRFDYRQPNWPLYSLITCVDKNTEYAIAISIPYDGDCTILKPSRPFVISVILSNIAYELIHNVLFFVSLV